MSPFTRVPFWVPIFDPLPYDEFHHAGHILKRVRACQWLSALQMCFEGVTADPAHLILTVRTSEVRAGSGEPATKSQPRPSHLCLSGPVRLGANGPSMSGRLTILEPKVGLRLAHGDSMAGSWQTSHRNDCICALSLAPSAKSAKHYACIEEKKHACNQSQLRPLQSKWETTSKATFLPRWCCYSTRQSPQAFRCPNGAASWNIAL